MRDPKLIELELDRARDDLEAKLAALQDILEHKLDLTKRAEEAIEAVVDNAIVHTKERIEDAIRAASAGLVDAAVDAKDGALRAARVTKDGVVDVYRRSRQIARDNPDVVVGVIAGVTATAVVLALLGRRYRWARIRV